MSPAANIVLTVFATAIGAFAIWIIVRLVNNWRKPGPMLPAIVIGGCLWIPFSWILVVPDRWDDLHMTWLKMWPVLPGFVPGAVLFHPQDGLEMATMGVTTVFLLCSLTWLGCRGRWSLAIAALVALLVSIPSAMIAYGAYRM